MTARVVGGIRRPSLSRKAGVNELSREKLDEGVAEAVPMSRKAGVSRSSREKLDEVSRKPEVSALSREKHDAPPGGRERSAMRAQPLLRDLALVVVR
jgi:hypothetical protein